MHIRRESICDSHAMRFLKRTPMILIGLLLTSGIPTASRKSSWGASIDRSSVCASRGSSVELTSRFYYPSYYTVTKTYWMREKKYPPYTDLSQLDQYKGRVTYTGDNKTVSTLRIHNLKMSDSSTYIFRFYAENYYGTDTYATPEGTSLRITELTARVPTVVRERERVTLQCDTTCELTWPQTLVWFKDGNPVASAAFSAKKEDTGNYHCAVKDQETTGSPPVSLDVQYGPQNVTITPGPTKDAVKGKQFTLTCNSEANPTVPEYNYRVLKKKGLSHIYVGQRTYRIQKVKPGDEGEYVCVAGNAIGSSWSDPVNLTIQYPPENVFVSIHPKEAVRGREVNLTCHSDASPPADRYTWYRGSGDSLVSTGPQLVKQQVSEADSGQYSCEATNKHGSQTSTSLHLDVLYPPENVSVSVQASPPDLGSSSSSVNLTCSSEANPAADYIWFRISGASGSDSLVQVGSGQVLSLASLQPVQRGPYICEAKNSIGGKRSNELLLDTEAYSWGRILVIAVAVVLVPVLLLVICLIWRRHQTTVVREETNVSAGVLGTREKKLSLSSNQYDCLYVNYSPTSDPVEGIPQPCVAPQPSPQTSSGPLRQLKSFPKTEEILYASIVFQPQPVDHRANLQDQYTRSPDEEEDSVVYSTPRKTR